MHLRWGKLYRGTEAEHALEPAVASLGVVYRTQYPLFLLDSKPALKYFPDFALVNDWLILEVDDPSHWTDPKKIASDKVRTAALKKKGWKVARCTNDEALQDPYAAVDRMLAELGSNLTTRRK